MTVHINSTKWFIALLAVLTCIRPVQAWVTHANAGFVFTDKMPGHETQRDPWIRASRFQGLTFNRATVEAILKKAPMEFTPDATHRPLEFLLPTPEGVFQRFNVVEAPIMEPPLATKFPEIRTFRGQGIDDPAATLRMDLTPQGFHAQVLTPGGGAWYIDPFSRGDSIFHTAYYRKDLRRTMPWTCGAHAQALGPRGPAGGPNAGRNSGNQVLTFRLAVAATGEYTAFHGGSVALAQAAIVTATNRVNGVFEVETAVRMVLVANNDLLVFTDSASDPYTNSDSEAMLTENQNTLDGIIGDANYDIGHVFATYLGGMATIGTVCSGGIKARAVTGHSAPTGDAFWVDFVAHEMGHQFSGEHTFNSSNQLCIAARAPESAYEPGSGSTIMSYSGSCDTVFPGTSDAYFHTHSYNKIREYVESAAFCGVSAATGNAIPILDAGPDYTIPRATPFTLTAIGSDADSDAVTFCWEELSLGPAQLIHALDNGISPLIRSRPPTTNPSRTVPEVSTLLGNLFDLAEELPSIGRPEWNWRCTIRDNRSGGGGVEEDNIVLTVADAAGPFFVTNPDAAGTFAGPVEVRWNVGKTDVAPVSCASVRILLSTDGGNTFPMVLASTTPNDGAQYVLLPSTTTTSARIKIEAVGNIFFDMSDVNFSIVPPASGVLFASQSAASVSDSASNGNGSGFADPGENAIALTVPIRNNRATTATAVAGSLSSLTATATVVSGTSAYPDLAINTFGINATPLTIALSPAHPCGTPVRLRMSMTSAQGSGIVDFSIPTGSPGITSTQTFYWVGSLAIPDNAPGGVSVPLSVTGLAGRIVTDVQFRFDNTGICNLSSGSGATSGVSHTYVGDLTVSLISPSGTSVTIINRPGAPGGGSNHGNHYCNTVLDDQSTLAYTIQNVYPEVAPFTGTFRPANPLSGFRGLSPNGTWVLNVSDRTAGDTGTLRAFSLILTTQDALCVPPVGGDGACCDQAAACTMTTQAQCAGTFQGPGSACGASGNPTTCCPVNYDMADGVGVQDIFDFLNGWFASDSHADFNGVNGVEVQDIFDFLNAWFVGCP